MNVKNFDDKITTKVVAGAHNIMMVMNNILMIPDIFIVTLPKVVAGAHNIHSILPEDTIQRRKVVDMWKVIEFIL